ncbi:hypothetical protein TNCT_147521 [Trichonephila clavata]|uniref:Uncharacterized protein n=1 Tax=Trichonephila clavata TaxID=2740835 RepID=A0A8X6JCI0_TRICU|nr:hypothetical protein TNCT_147521 [Trichonephila clavata]
MVLVLSAVHNGVQVVSGVFRQSLFCSGQEQVLSRTVPTRLEDLEAEDLVPIHVQSPIAHSFILLRPVYMQTHKLPANWVGEKSQLFTGIFCRTFT